MPTATEEAETKDPPLIFPGAFKGFQAVHEATSEAGLPDITRHMVHLRASQINGCGCSAETHAREMRDAGETDERIFSVAAWREASLFTEAERAALALTEALTRVRNRPPAVPDELWDEVRRHYDERAAAALVIEIGVINVWNRASRSSQAPGRMTTATKRR